MFVLGSVDLTAQRVGRLPEDFRVGQVGGGQVIVRHAGFSPLSMLVLVTDPLNLDAEPFVALRPRGPPRRICPLVPMAMIRRRGDRQHGADRLDPNTSRWLSMN